MKTKKPEQKSLLYGLIELIRNEIAEAPFLYLSIVVAISMVFSICHSYQLADDYAHRLELVIRCVVK